MNNNSNNSDNGDRPENLWEDNIDVSTPFEYPAFDACPLLHSELGAILMKELERRIRVSAIRRAVVISSLSDEDRQVYLLFVYHRKTFRQIGTMLGHDHKWAVRRYEAAESTIEQSCRPVGHEETRQYYNSDPKRRPENSLSVRQSDEDEKSGHLNEKTRE